MEGQIMRPDFFQLYTSVDDNVRHQLENQFQQLAKKISQVNKLLIDVPNLVGESEEFQRFHNEILDDEFRKAFGFTETVIVYLYKLKESDFDRVYVPEKWDDKKKAFMEQAIKDLRSYFLSGEELDRKKHLFLDIVERVEKHNINDEFQSYSTFLSEIKSGVKDELGSLHLAPESEQLFKDDMLIVTPLHNEAGEFWVTVNTYVDKHSSLFSQVRPEQFDALKRWYVTVHEAISECFLSVAHLLRLREKTLEYETLQRVSIISYLLSHPSVKLFTTPLKNAADDLKALGIDFSDDVKKQEQFNSTLDNIKLITDLWEGNLVVLEEFGALESNNKYTLDCQRIGVAEWRKIQKSLVEAAHVLFFNHINDLYDDPNYDDFVIPILRERRLKFSDFFKLSISLRNAPVCFGHPKLIALHLISFLENAIEAADFTKAADSDRKYNEIDDHDKNLISYKFFSEEGFGIVEVENNCRVKEHEEKNLTELGEFVEKLSRGEVTIGNFKKNLEERKFTTKSGTGFGWAIILAADYFNRLSVVSGEEELSTGIDGDLSIRVIKDETGAKGVKIRICLPLPRDPNEKVIIENKMVGRK